MASFTASQRSFIEVIGVKHHPSKAFFETMCMTCIDPSSFQPILICYSLSIPIGKPSTAQNREELCCAQKAVQLGHCLLCITTASEEEPASRADEPFCVIISSDTHSTPFYSCHNIYMKYLSSMHTMRRCNASCLGFGYFTDTLMFPHVSQIAQLDIQNLANPKARFFFSCYG